MSPVPDTAPDAAALARACLPDLTPVLTEPGHPLVFATVSGAHLYGFPSHDSDADLRGARRSRCSPPFGYSSPESNRCAPARWSRICPR